MLSVPLVFLFKGRQRFGMGRQDEQYTGVCKGECG